MDFQQMGIDERGKGGWRRFAVMALVFVLLIIATALAVASLVATDATSKQVDALSKQVKAQSSPAQAEDACKHMIGRTPTATSAIPGYNMGNGTVQSPGVATLGYTMSNDGFKVFHLYAQLVTQEIWDGSAAAYDRLYSVVPSDRQDPRDVSKFPIHRREMTSWGFNGQTPGPVIEVNKGDKVRIVFHNELQEATSVHWHGLIVPYEMDGSGGVSQKSVAPGESFTYEFTMEQCGTAMYHSGTRMWRQDPQGLIGVLVAKCPGEEPVADKDFSLMLSGAWLEGDSKCNTFMMDDSNWFFINGRSAPSVPVIKVDAGDRVRIRFSNANQDEPHPFHIHGHVWTQIGETGAIVPPSARVNGSTIDVAPGTTRDVLFTARPGVWRLHCHKILHTVFMREYWMAHLDDMAQYGGMITFVCVRGTTAAGTVITC